MLTKVLTFKKKRERDMDFTAKLIKSNSFALIADKKKQRKSKRTCLKVTYKQKAQVPLVPSALNHTHTHTLASTPDPFTGL